MSFEKHMKKKIWIGAKKKVNISDKSLKLLLVPLKVFTFAKNRITFK